MLILLLNLVTLSSAVVLFHYGLGMQSTVFLLFFMFCYFFAFSTSGTKKNITERSLLLFMIPVALDVVMPSSFRHWNLLLVALQVIIMLGVGVRRHAYRSLSAPCRPIWLFFAMALIAYISSRIVAIDPWAWQLRGDGINFVVSIRHISVLPNLLQALTGSLGTPGSGLGGSVMTQWLAQFSMDITHSSIGHLKDISIALLNVFLLSTLVAGFALLETFETRFSKIKPSKANFAFLTALIVAIIFFLGPIVGGLTISNGFLAVPLAVTCLFLVFKNAPALSEPAIDKSQIGMQFFLMIMLFLTWSLLSLIPLILILEKLIETLFFRLDHLEILQTKSIDPTAISLLAATSLCAVLAVPGVQETLVRSGGFPTFPLTRFGILLLLIFVGSTFLRTSNPSFSGRFLTAVYLWLLVFIAFFVFRFGGQELLKQLKSPWVTNAYYLEKAIWIVAAALSLNFIQELFLKEQWFALVSFVVFIAVPWQIGHAVWSKSERAFVSYEGIQRILHAPPHQRYMFFHYSSWPSDAYLNSIAGLQWENYDGHPGEGPHRDSPGFMPADSFTGRNWYTTEQNALCVGQKYLGEFGVILTKDANLASQRNEWCPVGPRIIVVP